MTTLITRSSLTHTHRQALETERLNTVGYLPPHHRVISITHTIVQIKKSPKFDSSKASDKVDEENDAMTVP